jgi:3-deoxy-7-phosphoheptulonate synthase
MILFLSENTDVASEEYKQLIARLDVLPGIKHRVHHVAGAERDVYEVYLIGNTKALEVDDMRSLPCVERVVRVSQEYRVLGRHKGDDRPSHFEYNGASAKTRCTCSRVCARWIRPNTSSRCCKR